MGPRRIIFGAALMGLMVLPSTASAGGWWNGLDLQGQVLGVGETFSFDSEVLFPEIETAKAANSADYRAYLVRGMDEKRLERATGRAEPGDWWSPPEEMIEIGTVSFSRRDANLSTATAHLEVPDVPTGTYNLMLCSPGCVEPVGNLFPLEVRVSSDPVLAKKVRRLTEKKWDLRTTVAGRKRDLREMNQKLIAAELAAETVDPRPPEVKTVAASSNDTTPWSRSAMWFIAGAVLTFVLTGARHKKSVPASSGATETTERQPLRS